MMKNKSAALFLVFLSVALACNLPGNVPAATEPEPVTIPTDTPSSALPQETFTPSPTSTIAVVHTMTPSNPSTQGSPIFDVESSGTAPEKRAPYGDSYDINRLERPFLGDMTYVPDLDILTYSVGQDADWFYVSIKLIGSDPNNSLGIHYGVEIDTNHDGFGDFVIWASPPYSSNWDTANVKIFADKNHDTGGLSSEKSDAPITTDGYETLIFNGGAGDADPDMAWARINAGSDATVQFAFKKSWSGTVFMLGVLADAGLKDAGKLDYVDRFTEEEAGSPVKDKKYYPLGSLFAVDNTCQEAFGFKPTGYEVRLCPKEPPPASPKTPKAGCTNPGAYTDQASCEAAGCAWRNISIIAVVYACVAP
jgi:hypothetical protein